MIDIVCGGVLRDDRLLVCRRAAHKALGGYWEFPGGKIEEGETPQLSLEREIEKEQGMKAHVGDHLTTCIHRYDGYCVRLIAYRCRFISANFSMTAHDRYEWVLPWEIGDFDLAPADIPVAQMLGVSGL